MNLYTKGIINARPRLRRLFRLRTILLMVMLSVLLLPLVSAFFFRVYENELVQKTELELIAQSAVIAATYRSLLGRESYPQPSMHGVVDSNLENEPSPFFRPVLPHLDLSRQPTLPARPDARPAGIGISPQDHAAGQQLQNIIMNTQRITLAGIRVLDKRGTVIAGRNDVGLSFAHVPEVAKALDGRYTPVIRERISDTPPPPIASLSRGTGIRVFTAFPVIDQQHVLGVIYASRTPQNILKHLYQIKEKVILLVVLILAATVLLVMFISSRLSRPIRELTHQTQLLASGDADTIEVLRQPGTYELSQLSTSFADMSRTLHERSTYIRQFASHVSHEFKTPLTSIQGALELLDEHGPTMTGEERKKFLGNIHTDTERLKNLVNRMLEFAHADARNPSRESSDLYAHLQKQRSLFRERNLGIEIPDGEHPLNINIAADALDTILGNLFENSLQHEANQVSITIAPHETSVTITLTDNGRGISPSNLNKIFTPFFTTRRQNGGTGLGLGIVESLLKKWKGNIRVLENPHGATFAMTLLRAKTVQLTRKNPN